MAGYSIGEFSKITGLSVKTLRYYHDRELLIPSYVDDSSRYRYYDNANIEKARIIAHFRKMEFPIDDIKQILDNYDDQADILDYLEKHKQAIRDRMSRYKKIASSLDTIISNEREAIVTMKSSLPRYGNCLIWAIRFWWSNMTKTR